jgi:hypothetical protein
VKLPQNWVRIDNSYKSHSLMRNRGKIFSKMNNIKLIIRFILKNNIQIQTKWKVKRKKKRVTAKKKKQKNKKSGKNKNRDPNKRAEKIR